MKNLLLSAAAVCLITSTSAMAGHHMEGDMDMPQDGQTQEKTMMGTEADQFYIAFMNGTADIYQVDVDVTETPNMSKMRAPTSEQPKTIHVEVDQVGSVDMEAEMVEPEMDSEAEMEMEMSAP